MAFSHSDDTVLGCLFPENYESLRVTLVSADSLLEQTISFLTFGVLSSIHLVSSFWESNHIYTCIPLEVTKS